MVRALLPPPFSLRATRTPHSHIAPSSPNRDTVGSVGVIPHPSLPFVQSNDAIRVFRHALALDERRVRFKPALYRYTHTKDALGIHPGDMPRNDTTWAVADPEELQPLLFQNYREQHRSREASEEQFCKGHAHKTDSKEVWFAGCHCGTSSLLCQCLAPVSTLTRTLADAMTADTNTLQTSAAAA